MKIDEITFYGLWRDAKHDKQMLARYLVIWEQDKKPDRAKLIERTKKYYTQKWDKLLISCVNREQRWICNKMINYLKGWCKNG